MYSNKVLNYQTTNPIKIKSLEELQADAKKRNDAEADKFVIILNYVVVGHAI